MFKAWIVKIKISICTNFNILKITIELSIEKINILKITIITYCDCDMNGP
jgi:hypothetical protein